MVGRFVLARIDKATGAVVNGCTAARTVSPVKRSWSPR